MRQCCSIGSSESTEFVLQFGLSYKCPAERPLSYYTGLFEMTVGVLTTCHTPRSPDATPCDLFLWGYVKYQVHVSPLPASTPELKVRIRTATETITADILQTVWNELDYRVDVCRITKGAHIEQL